MITLPTIEQVVAALKAEGAVEVTMTLVGPRGPTEIRCFRRGEGDEAVVSQPLPESGKVSWKEFDSICRQLGLNPRSIDLGVPRPPSWWEDPDELTEH